MDIEQPETHSDLSNKLPSFSRIFLLEKEWSRNGLLTEGLVLILHLWREEWSRCHGLFNAFHFIWLITDKPCRDRIITLLDCRRSSYRHIKHRSIVRIKALLLRLMQSVWNGVHLLGFTATDRIISWPLCTKHEHIVEFEWSSKLLA